MLGCCLVSFHFLLTILSTSTVPVLVVVAEPGGVDVVPVLSPAPAVPQVGVVRQLPEVAPAPEKVGYIRPQLVILHIIKEKPM